jgi:hypothetical protein
VGEMRPPLAFEATEGRWCWWWMRQGPRLCLRRRGVVVGDMRPPLAFGAKEGWWWVVVGETRPLLAFGATEGR